MSTPAPYYLEVTYRDGKAWAAYLYLHGRPGDKSVRTRLFEPDLVVDYAADGRAMGLEIINPSLITLDAINAVLAKIQCEAARSEDLRPLLAA